MVITHREAGRRRLGMVCYSTVRSNDCVCVCARACTCTCICVFLRLWWDRRVLRGREEKEAGKPAGYWPRGRTGDICTCSRDTVSSYTYKPLSVRNLNHNRFSVLHLDLEALNLTMKHLWFCSDRVAYNYGFT